MLKIIFLWTAELAAFLVAFWPWKLGLTQVLAHTAIVAVVSLCVLVVAYSGAVFAIKSRFVCLLIFLFVGSYFAVLCMFHLIVMGALASWGQLPTFEMVATYLREIRYLEQSIGVSQTALTLLLGGGWLTSIALHAALWRKLSKDESARLSVGLIRYPSPRVAVLLIVFVLLTLPSTMAVYVTSVGSASLTEPLYVAVNGDVWRRSQENPTTELRARQAQKADDDARAAYVSIMPMNRRNIVVITVDALRPDRMSLYGHTRQTTPNLDLLARRSLLTFSPEARAPCAESFCGLLSLLTGKQGHKLANRDFGLVEVLGLYGYKRYAALSGDHSRFYGLRERYGPFDEYFDGSMAPLDTSLNDDATVVSRVEKLPLSESRPTFFYFHLMSAHGLGRKLPEFQRWLPAKSVYNLRVKQSDDTLISEVKNGYDNGVLQADAMIAKILTALREKRYLEDAIIFITGDHGDFLGEQGRFSHSQTLLEPVLRVPWIWVGDGVGALNLTQPVVHADFAPTLLTMLEMPVPMNWDGRVLQTSAPLAFSYHQQGVFAGLVSYQNRARIKFVVDRTGEREAVFDLLADPGELLNIKDAIPRAQLENWRNLLAKQQLFRPFPCDQTGRC